MHIIGLHSETRENIRYAVHLAMECWPNAHLGTRAPREDMRSAFKMIRRYTEHPDFGLAAGVGALVSDAYRHADM